MSGPTPPIDFDQVELRRAPIPAGEIWSRIFRSHHQDPLGVGPGPSRFGDPGVFRGRDPEFCVLYLGSSLKVCFAEAVLRDSAVATAQPFFLDREAILSRNFARIRIIEELNMVDLRGDNTLAMRIPTDVPRGSDHKLSSAWSSALHAHPDQPDGIIYSSRLNEEPNLAIYDRAIGKLDTNSILPLGKCDALVDVLDSFGVSVRRSTPEPT